VDASPSSGLKVKHGTIELSLRAEDLSFQITACRLNGNSITGSGVMRVPDAMALYYGPLADRVLNIAISLIRAGCQRAWDQDVYVVRDSVLRIIPANKITSHFGRAQEYGLHCDNLSQDSDYARAHQSPFVNCDRIKDFPAVVEHRRLVDSIASGERAEIERQAASERQQAQQAAVAAAERQRLEQIATDANRARQIQQQRKARRDDLSRTFGAMKVMTLDQLAPNPFAFKGTQIGTCAYFTRMLNESAALMQAGMSQAEVRGVPSTRFTQRDAAVFLVARVLGRNGDIPLLQYVAAVNQADGCPDYFDL
jgi:hypothetical protein